MAPAVEYSRPQPRNSWPTPTTTKIAARTAERWATARPPRRMSTCGMLGAGERRGRFGARLPRALPAGPGRRGLVSVAAHDEMHVGGEDERHEERPEDEGLQRLPHGQREHVEADVVAEDGVLLAERR